MVAELRGQSQRKNFKQKDNRRIKRIFNWQTVGSQQVKIDILTLIPFSFRKFLHFSGRHPGSSNLFQSSQLDQNQYVLIRARNC